MIFEKRMSDQELLKLITEHSNDHLTYRRLAEITGYSLSTIYNRMQRLEIEGKVERIEIITYKVKGDGF